MIYSFWWTLQLSALIISQLPISLKITAASLIKKEPVGHYTNKFTETGLDFFIKYLLRASHLFNADFATANGQSRLAVDKGFPSYPLLYIPYFVNYDTDTK